MRMLDEKYVGWKDDATEEDLQNSGALASLYKAKSKVTDRVVRFLNQNIDEDFQNTMRGRVPLRLEFTLREFASPEPVNCFFSHPIHVPDNDGVLDAADPLSHIQGEKKEKVKKVKKSKEDAFYEVLFATVLEKGFATYSDLSLALKKSDRTIKRMVDKINDDYVVVTGGGKDETRIYFSGEEPGHADEG